MSAHNILMKENTVKQVSLHAHFEDGKHHVMSNWKITLIDQTETVMYPEIF